MNIRFPSSVALAAAIIVSVMSILQKCTFEIMAGRLIITIVVFFILGFICKFILDDVLKANNLEEMDLNVEHDLNDANNEYSELGDADEERISELQFKSDDDEKS